MRTLTAKAVSYRGMVLMVSLDIAFNTLGVYTPGILASPNAGVYAGGHRGLSPGQGYNVPEMVRRDSQRRDPPWRSAGVGLGIVSVELGYD